MASSLSLDRVCRLIHEPLQPLCGCRRAVVHDVVDHVGGKAKLTNTEVADHVVEVHLANRGEMGPLRDRNKGNFDDFKGFRGTNEGKDATCA